MFNSVNTELELAPSLTTAASVSFFLDNINIYLDTVRLYDHIIW